VPHLRRDGAHPCHICAGTALPVLCLCARDARLSVHAAHRLWNIGCRRCSLASCRRACMKVQHGIMPRGVCPCAAWSHFVRLADCARLLARLGGEATKHACGDRAA
jgi:hypothetical protein